MTFTIRESRHKIEGFKLHVEADNLVFVSRETSSKKPRDHIPQVHISTLLKQNILSFTSWQYQH